MALQIVLTMATPVRPARTMPSWWSHLKLIDVTMTWMAEVLRLTITDYDTVPAGSGSSDGFPCTGAFHEAQGTSADGRRHRHDRPLA
jgi:hypothetical protein